MHRQKNVIQVLQTFILSDGKLHKHQLDEIKYIRKKKLPTDSSGLIG